MRLNKNLASLNIYKNYNDVLVKNASALNRISTGVKINSSKDNPSKIGLSEGLRLQLRSLEVAERNVQDGVSMLQTFDGILGTVNETLSRIRKLTVQSGGVTSEDDLNVIQNEINQLNEHIDTTVNNAEFNQVKLLNSDKVLDNNNPNFLRHTIGTADDEEVKIPIFNIKSSMLKDSDGNALADVDVTNKDNMDKNLKTIDESINAINSIRSKYGAIQNRLETASLNLNSSSINLQKSESRITDADIALEMAEYARTSLLTETSLALMQQSNNFPKDVLKVLENMK